MLYKTTTYNKNGDEAGERRVPVSAGRCSFSHQNTVKDEVTEAEFHASYKHTEHVFHLIQTHEQQFDSSLIHEHVSKLTVFLQLLLWKWLRLHPPTAVLRLLVWEMAAERQR